MKRRLFSLLTALCLCLCLTVSLTDTAHAGDWDLIRQYDVTVTPNAQDGSLHIRLDLQWEVLDEGPVEWVQIGIPNGSIRDVVALTDNIHSLSFDNSFMYVYFTRGYDDGEVISFSYEWTQEYMYTLGDDGSVTYDYTPGWFDGINIQCMTLIWNLPGDLPAPAISLSTTDGQWADYSAENAFPLYEGRGLGHGAQLNIVTRYDSWPTDLLWEMSSENLPEENWSDDEWYDDDYYYEEDDDAGIIALFVFLLILYVVFRIILAADGYSAGFGTRYVFYHGLWYPAGRDGKPRPGSVGTSKKPSPPRSSGGFGGGSRGGGFGGGGFGGGGHCACASSCACACACACAGGGRAGCSAKNLYGSVQLSRQLTEKLTEE